MSRRSKSTQRRLEATAFLRSINIEFDAGVPGRIAHFRPTAKSVRMITALCGEDPARAFLITAPYGTGKSLAATYALNLVENRTDGRAYLRVVEKRLGEMSGGLAQFSAKRLRNRKRGLVLPISGYRASLAESLLDAGIKAFRRIGLVATSRTLQRLSADTLPAPVEIVAKIQELCVRANLDRLIIIWDEFGRHLESLIEEGKAARLDELQGLAEQAARSKKVPTVLCLLLHQGLLNYANRAPQATRTEWAKIEGRFEKLEYVDDSKEIYRLIGELVEARAEQHAPSAGAVQRTAKRISSLDLFPEYSSAELHRLIASTAPLNPITLFLLPRISARVAQNERTLFSFVNSVDLSRSVGPAELYDYFSTAMRSDHAVGGTHRQWLETESALAKTAGNDLERSILKATCLLSLGIGGERSRARRRVVELAVSASGRSDQVAKAIDSLIERNLLLFRRHADEVSVWHGTDVDLRTRLSETIERVRGSFALIPFLETEAPLPTWRPLEYNAEFGVRRYLPGDYIGVRQVGVVEGQKDFFRALPNSNSPAPDGRILYVVAEREDELEQAAEIVAACRGERRLVVAIPREPLPITEAAVEVAALLEMQRDRDLLDADPLVATELQHMIDDARAHLQRLVDRISQPGPNGPRWFYKGAELTVQNRQQLRKRLSGLMRDIFSMTPRINNEMIVRQKPSAVIVNSRKKLLLGILERCGQPLFGIQGNPPEASIGRAVLSKLYIDGGTGTWRFLSPEELPADSQGLREVWTRVRDLVSEPSERPANLKEFFRSLADPPIGLRAGLFPIFLAGGLKAFPAPLSLLRDGEYVTDILPSEVEQLCKEPDRFRLQVLALSAADRDYLRAVRRIFGESEQSVPVPEGDLFRGCYDAIQLWKHRVPEAALTARDVSPLARSLQRVLTVQSDPVSLLLETIPKAFGRSRSESENLVTLLDEAVKELEGIAERYRQVSVEIVRRCLGISNGKWGSTLREIVSGWARCFPAALHDTLPEDARATLTTMLSSYQTDDQLLDRLAGVVAGRPLSRWDDSSVALFERGFNGIVHRIEEQAFSLKSNGPANGLSRVFRTRLENTFDRLLQVAGDQEAQEAIESLRARLRGVDHADGS